MQSNGLLTSSCFPTFPKFVSDLLLSTHPPPTPPPPPPLGSLLSEREREAKNPICFD